MSDRPTWVGIFWTNTKEWTIQRADSVKKEEMFADSNIIGMVEHQGREKDKPPSGWKSFPGRVIASGSKYFFITTHVSQSLFNATCFLFCFYN